MVVKIRLARFGKRHSPFYNIVVMRDRTARNAKPIEVIGTYDPIPKPPPDGIGKPFKDIQLDVSRAKYWLGVGAQPTDPMWRILAMFGAIEPSWKITRLKTQNPEAASPSLPRKDLTKSASEKQRLREMLLKEPEAFRSKLAIDVKAAVEKWREQGFDIPRQWLGGRVIKRVDGKEIREEVPQIKVEEIKAKEA